MPSIKLQTARAARERFSYTDALTEASSASPLVQQFVVD
jgi:hypothetical protein